MKTPAAVIHKRPPGYLLDIQTLAGTAKGTAVCWPGFGIGAAKTFALVNGRGFLSAIADLDLRGGFCVLQCSRSPLCRARLAGAVG